MDLISIVVIATFGLIALAALASLIYWCIKLVARARLGAKQCTVGDTKNIFRARDTDDEDDEDSDTKDTEDGDEDESSSHVSLWDRVISGARRIRMKAKRARREFDDDEDDELPEQVTALLSAVPLDSVIVDTEGEVLRSSPAAYRLGIVANDAVVSEQISDALFKVFRDGRTQKLDIVTHTPIEYVDDNIARDADFALAERDESSREDDAAGTVGTVSRRNWLKVTVARVDESQAVILIADVSEQRRFTRIRDAFISNVTEQLLKPTHALEKLGMELESDHLDQASLLKYAEQVRQYSGSLNHLVSDLLLLLKAQEPITASAANRVEVKPLVERIIARHTVVAAEHGVTLHEQMDKDLVVNGQVDQLEGAISKLIDNAIDYSPRGAVVGIAATRTHTTEGDGVVLRVVDHGAGISKRDQPHIFERFWRGENQTNRSRHGTGLGLAIVKHVALTHRGSVSVWSAPGEGSTFSLALPSAQS
jgi:signal transduction histidine kinase